MIPYISINEEMKKRYGEKVYRLSINAGLSCPNRDGRVGTGGCIFCSAGGSGDFAPNKSLSIREQLDIGKEIVRKKAPDCKKFIAYFQAYTNTYGSIDYLKSIYEEAMEDSEVVVLSIATRPDCLSTEVLDLLEECNRKKSVWVELGLQTIHKKTSEFIRRGYDLSVYDKAVYELQKREIEVITHVILGLPGESKEEMLSTVKYVSESGANGIKLQLLHVLKGTDLATVYEQNPFHIMDLEEYTDILIDCLKILPSHMVVHRITGDGPKQLLIEPSWTQDKKVVLNTIYKAINHYMKEHSVEVKSL